jgi:ABC-type multidrug transport system ATPase subunit
MNQPALSLRSVKLPRGSLRELDVDFMPGVHVIVGPNGIGKTSLLNSIAGTLPPVSGSILLHGQPLGDSSARVILAPNVPPDIPWIRSGLLLDFVLSLYPATRQDARFAVATLGASASHAFMDAPLGCLSARRRTAVAAAALIAAPPVMLFDEPTNDIDAPSSAAFVEMIGAAARKNIVIVTTHHAQDLASLQPQVLDLTTV